MERKPILVVAVGGNALLQRGQAMTCVNQQQNIEKTTAALAKLAEQFRLVLVHGNGPQVGLLALQNLAYSEIPSYPLDVLGAESQGMIGYLLAQGLKQAMPHGNIATLLTQIEVDCQDPAFDNPNKFIGPVYSQAEAEALAAEYQWSIKADGNFWRRVVPSPKPQGINELGAIKALIDAEQIVICCGGGGSPVVCQNAQYKGIEAVIDKDLAAALLARQLGAEHLLILTDADNVVLNWGEPNAQPLETVTVSEIQQYEFAAGSMGPKVDAVCQFAVETGGTGHIGSLEKAIQIMNGVAGTHIIPDSQKVSKAS